MNPRIFMIALLTALLLLSVAALGGNRDDLVLAICLALIVLGAIWSAELPQEDNEAVGPVAAWLISPTVRAIEVVAVFLAVAAFIYDFAIEKPRDRAMRNGQLLASIADLARENIRLTSPAIKNIMRVLNAEGVSMRELSVPGVNLTGAVLIDADLQFAILNRADFRDADFRGANLTGAELLDAQFYRANFTGANFTSAFLHNANFHNARMDGANLAWSVLTNAKLGAAELGGANFTGAHVEGAEFSSSRLVDRIFVTKPITQAQINTVSPSGPPRSLPPGVVWPFKKSEGIFGVWERKN